MGNSNGLDLFEMMATVNQVESSPLVDAKRAQNHVGDTATRAEESFRLVEELVETSQMFA